MTAGSTRKRPMRVRPTYGLPDNWADDYTPMMLSPTPNHKGRMADGCRRATESDPRR